MKKKEIFIWIISLIIPVIGIVLYFVFKNKDKKLKSSAVKGCIVGFSIYSIFILYIATHGTNYINRNIDEWYEDVNSGKLVVTIFGASYCQHCQAYKPVIQKLARKNNIDLYFYEMDTLSEEDNERLNNSFNVGEYDGYPYTFIMKNKELVDSYVGYQFESDIVTFLSQYMTIKN